MAKSILLEKADEYARAVYNIIRKFPREEVFGITSQLRRAALSVPLNITEGFARQSRGSYRQFISISYASLKESPYLLGFSLRESYIEHETYENIVALGNEIARMLWAALRTLKA